MDLKEIQNLIKFVSNSGVAEVKLEMDNLKENVISNLKSSLNESKDSDLTATIENTIKKIVDSPYDRYNLYKLRNLNKGL
jgi:hypothetical protein